MMLLPEGAVLLSDHPCCSNVELDEWQQLGNEFGSCKHLQTLEQISQDLEQQWQTWTAQVRLQ
jgi:hypothetical protein